MQCPDVDIRGSGPHACRGTAAGKIRIDQRAEIFVLAISLQPERVELVKNAAGHFECTPDPRRARIILFYLNLEDAVFSVSHDSIEKLRLLHREEEKGELIVR